MKVVISLTSVEAELLRSNMTAANVHLHNSYRKEELYEAGSLTMLRGWRFNENQSIALKDTVMTIEGDRYAISLDGILDLVIKTLCPITRSLFSSTSPYAITKARKLGKIGLKKLKVISYSTSDIRLNWWDTPTEHLSRMTRSRLIEEFIKMTDEKFKGYLSFSEDDGGRVQLFDRTRFSWLTSVDSEEKAIGQFTGKELTLWKRYRNAIQS